MFVAESESLLIWLEVSTAKTLSSSTSIVQAEPKMPHGAKLVSVGSVLLVATLLVSCRDQPTQTRVTASELLAAVTEDVTDRIDRSGHFILAGSPQSGSTEISEGRARELASAYWKTYSSSLRASLASERGAQVASELESCSRAFYTESGYEQMGPSVPKPIRRAFGNQWIVGLCKGQQQQIAIAVAAEATDLTINAQGKIVDASAGDFLSIGVPVGATIPVVPELSAVTALKSFGVRVADVPKLRRMASRSSGFNSYWSLPVERPALVRGIDSRAARSIGSLSFGFYSGWRDARLVAENPKFSDEVREETLGYAVSSTETIQVVLIRRSDVPARMELVVRGDR